MKRGFAIVPLLALASAGSAADKFEAATLKQAPPPTGDSYSITLVWSRAVD